VLAMSHLVESGSM
jgi:hypothetical protein